MLPQSEDEFDVLGEHEIIHQKSIEQGYKNVINKESSKESI